MQKCKTEHEWHDKSHSFDFVDLVCRRCGKSGGRAYFTVSNPKDVTVAKESLLKGMIKANELLERPGDMS